MFGAVDLQLGLVDNDLGIGTRDTVDFTVDLLLCKNGSLPNDHLEFLVL